MRIVCCFALQAEAKPWIEVANARLCYQQKHLRYYEGSQLNVLVSGMGSIAMATAMGWLNGFMSEEKCVWNIGCAASVNRHLHNWYRIAKITSEWPGAGFYPEMLSQGKYSYATLHTVNTVANAGFLQTMPDCLVDMEGYSFAKAARQFLPVTQIQLLKWVSDAGEEKFYLNTAWQQLYEMEIQALLQYIQHETAIVKKNLETYYPQWNNSIEKVNEKLSLTFTQKVQLKNALSFAMQYRSDEQIEKLIDDIPFQITHKVQRNSALIHIIEQLYAI